MNERGTVDRLRREISSLWEKRARGDVSERVFQKESERVVLELCSALVRVQAGENENILLEHHVVRAHTKIAGSVLRESEQEFISLLATDRRLFRLRAVLHPDQPLLFKTEERDELEEMDLESVSKVVVRRQRRTGEIVAGLSIAAFSVLFRSSLEITGIALFLLGMAGALHGLLLPTRWAEVRTDPEGERIAFEIWALRKKSGRALVRFLRRRIPRG
jgi:hypothetical protein